MILDLRPLDLVALATFLGVWVGYGTLFDGVWRRPSSINARMLAIREVWMIRMMSRGVRIVDSQLIGHSIHSATFFASTTIILLAGLVGVLGSAERVHSTATSLSIVFAGTSQGMFELKVLLLIAVYVYAFFKFTWAIRQFNYFCAVIGAAPEGAETPPDRAMAKQMAMVLTHAIWQFNSGVRAHYFALAALGWMVHPLVFLAMTLVLPFLLIRRQLLSPTSRAIAALAHELAAPSADHPTPPDPVNRQ